MRERERESDTASVTKEGTPAVIILSSSVHVVSILTGSGMCGSVPGPQMCAALLDQAVHFSCWTHPVPPATVSAGKGVEGR